MLKLNCGLDRLPTFTAAARPGYDGPPPHRAMVTITTGIDATQAACDAARRGEPRPAWCELYFQTAYDASVAPPGAHTMSVFAQYVPVRAGGPGDWDRRREEIADMVIAEIARFAPDVADCIVERQVLGPPDVEARIGLTGGHIFQGECLPDQMWDRRFAPGTPVPGLYLCGAGTHPGGSVIAANGRNAAMAVLAAGRRRRHTASIAARTRAATSAASSGEAYFSRGQKNPRRPSFRCRGTTCTCRWATLWEMRLLLATNDAVGAEAGLHGRRHPPGDREHRHQQRVGQLGQRHHVLAGHDQRVALEHRPVIEEGDDVGIGVDDVVVGAGDPPATMAQKDAACAPAIRGAYVG